MLLFSTLVHIPEPSGYDDTPTRITSTSPYSPKKNTKIPAPRLHRRKSSRHIQTRPQTVGPPVVINRLMLRSWIEPIIPPSHPLYRPISRFVSSGTTSILRCDEFDTDTNSSRPTWRPTGFPLRRSNTGGSTGLLSRPLRDPFPWSLSDITLVQPEINKSRTS